MHAVDRSTLRPFATRYMGDNVQSRMLNRKELGMDFKGESNKQLARLTSRSLCLTSVFLVLLRKFIYIV